MVDFFFTEIPDTDLDCLRSLSRSLSNPLDDLAKIRSAKGERVLGTCEWILAQAQYTSWLNEGGPQLLWLSGGPGIGKTMMSTFLTEELTQLTERSPQRTTLIYFFCDDKNERRKTATVILRVHLLQILRQRPTLFKHIQPDFQIIGDDLFTDFHALWRMFVDVLKDEESGEVYCLIDALDECEVESRQLFLTSFKRLFNPQQSIKTTVKFIITSRRLIEIEESLSASRPAMQDLQVDSAKINGDLNNFINTKVDEISRKKRYAEDLKKTIIHALMEKAGGTFLYVSLVLEDLNRTKVQSLVRKKLLELPSDLNEVYDHILSQIEVDHVEIAVSILRWVAVAQRPLTVKELATARLMEDWEEDTAPLEENLEEFKDDFRSCGPLVYFESGSGTINLVHQSAKEYLLGEHLQKKHSLSKYHVVLDKTNILIFRACATYLRLRESRKETVILWWYRSHDFCFLEYASSGWLHHALAAGSVLPTEYESLRDTLKALPMLRDKWLLAAAKEGQEAVVQQLLEEGAGVDTREFFERTSLLWAAAKGHLAVVRLLIEKGAEIDALDDIKQTPLSWAAEEGHLAVVRLLIEKGAEVDARNQFDETPLWRAARYGHLAVVQLLLEKGADVEARDKSCFTPLEVALVNGHLDVVALLKGRAL